VFLGTNYKQFINMSYEQFVNNYSSYNQKIYNQLALNIMINLFH
jgi:hypothetical protein